MKLPIPLIIVVASFGLQLRGEARAYTPLSQAVEPASVGRPVYLAIDPEARPMLPGMRPIGLELLEDALRRKQPHDWRFEIQGPCLHHPEFPAQSARSDAQ